MYLIVCGLEVEYIAQPHVGLGEKSRPNCTVKSLKWTEILQSSAIPCNADSKLHLQLYVNINVGYFCLYNHRTSVELTFLTFLLALLGLN